MGIYILIYVFGFASAIVVLALCRASGTADERAERAWQNQRWQRQVDAIDKFHKEVDKIREKQERRTGKA